MTTSCESVQELLSPYCDDEVSTEERATIEAHIQYCDACHTVLDEFQGFSQLFETRFHSITAPNTLGETVLARVDAARDDVQIKRLSIVYLVCAGFIALVVGAALFSPFGVLLLAPIRIVLPVLRFALSLLPTMGSSGIAVMVISFVAVFGLSIFGISRLIRQTRTEGVV